jgi:hypothetical protein
MDMKKIMLTLLTVLVLTPYVYAQSMDSLYVVTYTTGSSWDMNKPPHEQTYFKEHSARLGQLRKEGVIKFGARYGEKGMIVIAASSSTAANDIVHVDQAVINKLFVADVQKLNIFYDGCLERAKIKN